MKTIMLVDDSPTMFASIEAVLKNANYLTQTLGSAEKAIEKLRDGGKPDLIITDLHMGAMSGIDLIAQARQLPALRFVPILMLTSETRPARRVEARAAGASGWLIKPIDANELLEVLHQLLPCDVS